MSVKAAYDVIQDPNTPAFQNPAASAISDTTTGCVGGAAYLATLPPSDEVTAAEKRITCLTTGTTDPALPDYYTIQGVGLSMGYILLHTNYFSGVDASPPPGLNTQGMSYMSILSCANGMGQVAKEFGEDDPLDPCNHINQLCGSVLGKLSNMLSPVLTILNALVNGLMTLANFIIQLDNLVRNIYQLINGEIEMLKEYLKKLADYALANFLNSMISNPCLKALVGVVGTEALNKGISEIPNLG